eukprot:Em0019g372a
MYIQAVSVLNSNNTLRHLEISWIPVGGNVTTYTVRVVGTDRAVGEACTLCSTTPCLYVHQITPIAHMTYNYSVLLKAINPDGTSGLQNSTTIYGPTNSIFRNASFVSYDNSIGCSFLRNQSFYCMVCCSTDPSVPPETSVYNISTTKGTEVNVSLQGLTSDQMYYCKAAATNTNSTKCTGPVVGGVKIYFSLIPPTKSTDVFLTSIDVIGITIASSFVVFFSLGALVVTCCCCCVMKRRSKDTPHPPDNETLAYEMSGMDEKIACGKMYPRWCWSLRIHAVAGLSYEPLISALAYDQLLLEKNCDKLFAKLLPLQQAVIWQNFVERKNAFNFLIKVAALWNVRHDAPGVKVVRGQCYLGGFIGGIDVIEGGTTLLAAPVSNYMTVFQCSWNALPNRNRETRDFWLLRSESFHTLNLSLFAESFGGSLSHEDTNGDPVSLHIPFPQLGPYGPYANHLASSNELNPQKIHILVINYSYIRVNGKCILMASQVLTGTIRVLWCLGKGSHGSFKMLASRLAIISGKPKSAVLSELYSRLNLYLADKARLLSISSPHASAWLSVTPSEGLGLHLDPPVFQIAVKWWLGLDTSEGSQCTLCRGVLDHLGHHAVTCKYGGDVVSRHNKIRDILVETCRRAHIGVQVEVGNNLTHDHNKTRPADILLSNWFLGKPAALDVSITSPLNPLTLLEAGVLAKSAAQVTEARKHQANDPKCSELGWVCVPMVAESYGAWGDEASSIISSIASRLATSTCKSKSVVLNDIYGRLNVHLVRANATAILSRIIPLS